MLCQKLQSVGADFAFFAANSLELLVKGHNLSNREAAIRPQLLSCLQVGESHPPTRRSCLDRREGGLVPRGWRDCMPGAVGGGAPTRWACGCGRPPAEAPGGRLAKCLGKNSCLTLECRFVGKTHISYKSSNISCCRYNTRYLTNGNYI